MQFEFKKPASVDAGFFYGRFSVLRSLFPALRCRLGELDFEYAEEMLKKFRSYQIAVRFYKACEFVRGPRHLQDQLLRAASSAVLNLAEGSERGSDADQRRFYRMAMGSTRECQAILDLLSSNVQTDNAKKICDTLAGSVFQLCKSIDIKLSSQPK